MTDVKPAILDLLAVAKRPLTTREIALDVSRMQGISVKRNEIVRLLGGEMGELLRRDGCGRWRLISRNDLTDTIQRRKRPQVPEEENSPTGSSSPPPIDRVVPDGKDEEQSPPAQKDHWEQFKYLLETGARNATRAITSAEMLTKISPQARSFLQWAADLEAEKQRLQAEIDLHDGCADVWVLYDLSGTQVNARVVNGASTAQWQILDTEGRTTRIRVPYRPRRVEELEKRGFREVCERRPAVAMIVFARTDAKWPRVEAVLKVHVQNKRE